MLQGGGQQLANTAENFVVAVTVAEGLVEKAVKGRFDVE